MELPSMVQRSGDTLIVRSVVSGNQIYMDHGINAIKSPDTIEHGINPIKNSGNSERWEKYNVIGSKNAKAKILNETQLEVHPNRHQMQNHCIDDQIDKAFITDEMVTTHILESKDDCLPQCKIKRNYSCSYCTYFTQNPRYHLTHLRDVHGEKIVINKCKLCLYASRHFQKLVRHMKMVHGCTDGITSDQNQPRGKRGISRAARKLKLEQSIALDRRIIDSKKCGEKVITNFGEDYQHLGSDELNNIQKNTASTKPVDEKHTNLEFTPSYDCGYQDKDTPEQRRIEHYRTASLLSLKTDINHSTANDLRSDSFRQSSSADRNSRNGDHASVANNKNESTVYDCSIQCANDYHSSTEYGPTRLLKCSICEFTTPCQEDLTVHETDEHCRTKFYRCEKCSYVTHIKTRFSKHVKYHSMPMIKCIICDFRTPYKWNLDRHMKNHGGAGPFKCAACDFTADIKQSLTVHEMNHHIPPVGHMAGMSFARRRNKVGGTDILEDFFSDSMDMCEEQFNTKFDSNDNNNNVTSASLTTDIYGEAMNLTDNDKPTDLSKKWPSKNAFQQLAAKAIDQTSKVRRPVPSLIPLPSTEPIELAESQYSLSKIASMFFNEGQLSEMINQLNNQQGDPAFTSTIISQNTSHGYTKKRASSSNSSFFDKLKSSALMVGGGPDENLVCPCGHLAKCLSEAIIHRKSCSFVTADEDNNEDDDDDDRLEIDFRDEDGRPPHSSAVHFFVTNSTRCQHCRQRCKSSIDLTNHLKSCCEAIRSSNESNNDNAMDRGRVSIPSADLGQEQFHPIENRIFIWNNPNNKDSQVGYIDSFVDAKRLRNDHRGSEDGYILGDTGTSSLLHSTKLSKSEEDSYYGVETAPGYGEVTKKMTPEEEAANSSLKKVYKCPHCSFWASTASRFHVHIVGHLNKKPFECSLCSYRSNWRWDITKHIRLKTIRDPGHKTARVLMNDETGRRNYTKYNKYITLMKVTEEDGDPKLMKSGEMTPNQVASLAFLKDFKKGPSQSTDNINQTDNSIKRLNDFRKDTSRESFIHLPLLATMMNAALAQQQSAKESNLDQQTTLITPTVTISAIKRVPPCLKNISDHIIFEENEKDGLHKCRHCTYRHSNRDIVIAHLSSHHKVFDVNSSCCDSGFDNTSPLQKQQDGVNEDLFISGNKPEPKRSLTLPVNALKSKIATNSASCEKSKDSNSSHKTSEATILEHGEQKANQIEASAQPLPESLQLKKRILGVGDGISANLKPPLPVQPQQLSMLVSGQINLTEYQHSKSVTKVASKISPAHTDTLSSGHNNSNITLNDASMSGVVVEFPRSIHGLTTLHPFPPSITDQSTGAAALNAPGSILSACSKTIIIKGNTAISKSSGVFGWSKESPAFSVLKSPPPQPLKSRKNSIEPITEHKSITKQPSYQTINGRTDECCEPSPYRCGHCHQVSNWKHVIQRHCRLKHDGDVLIETLDRSTLPKHHIDLPKYRSLGFGESNCNRDTVGFNSKTTQDTQDNCASILKSATLRNMNETESAKILIGATSCPSTKICHESSSEDLYETTIRKLNNTGRLGTGEKTEKETHNLSWKMLEANSMTMYIDNYEVRQKSKSKQQMCPLCPYISESKSQMNYHVSLHRPTQYECPLCTFICSKKQHLSSHLRTVHQQTNKCNELSSAISDFGKQFNLNGQQISPLNINESIDSDLLQQQKPISHSREAELIASYCSKCPARFIGHLGDARGLLKAHMSGHLATETTALKCEFCDFQVDNITDQESHRYVHSEMHIRKHSNHDKMNITIDEKHPPPKYKKITSTDQHDIGWVVNNEKQLSDYLAHVLAPANSLNYCSSLLKKHLESYPDDCSQTVSQAIAESVHIQKSIADLTSDPIDNSDNYIQPPHLKNCPHCPYETISSAQYTDHLQHHISITNHTQAFTCEHCDYTAMKQHQIEEHNVLHFNYSEKLNAVTIYTSYDELQLCVQEEDGKIIRFGTTEIKNNLTGCGESVKGNRNVEKCSNEMVIEHATNMTTASEPTTKTIEVDEINEQYKNKFSNSGRHENCASAIGVPSVNSGGSFNISVLNPEINQQPQNKTILVNAKTGQVIERNNKDTLKEY